MLVHTVVGYTIVVGKSILQCYKIGLYKKHGPKCGSDFQQWRNGPVQAAGEITCET